ncbi:DNA polymerase III subunit delta [uncultured Rhodoblastus sp.]|uniref:DNA polymerase III subunit delta n=1 Tax=uncultured Rhodoblastus sp. TaxID=543037 RepID=UPI0025E840ED|nr:DNA polymerase III subunit delta [uncultured Rhodoblastus sp.]
MAIVSHHEADRYLLRRNPDHFLFLIFGADPGLVAERCRTLLRSVIGDSRESLQLVALAGDQIAADPLTLIDEANSIGLFGSADRVIRISLGGKSLLPALEWIAQAPPVDCLIVVEAGELKRDAPIRKWIDKQTFAASIECLGDDAKDIQRLIDAELKAANLTIEPDARDALGAMLGEDRLSTRSELGKLVLYAHGQGAITLAHIDEILNDASAMNIDAAIFALFSGRPALTVELVNKALRSGIDANALLGQTTRYALALHRGLVETENGGSFDGALQIVLRQFNAYNRKAEITSHLRNASRVKIETIIKALQDLVKRTRQANYLGEEYVARLFLAFAASLKRN